MMLILLSFPRSASVDAAPLLMEGFAVLSPNGFPDQ